MDENAITVTSE